jgi:paraquat-inducible protein B
MSNTAHIESTTRISKVWLIPIVALLIGAWMVFYQWQNQGPLITIDLTSASGIEVNKTPIKVKDLEVGQVKKIELKPDLEGVTVTARINASAARLLTENTEFWVVAPRISFSEVSGLNTLLSGSYIAMSADDKGAEKRHFTALERPPVTPLGTPGLHLTFSSISDDMTYNPGDSIIYKGFKVGEFENAYFNVDEGEVNYTAFIKAPYHKLITENTRFWNISGVKLQLASTGLTIQTGSLETLLASGVTFGVPKGASRGAPVKDNTFFRIYTDYNAASDERFKYAAQYLLLIEESVRGLTPGAPVEYRGLQIGKVDDIDVTSLDTGTILDEDFPIPVLISIYPGKVHQPDSQAGLDFLKARLQQWMQKDLRASLRMGNVITGGLYVDLQHVTNPNKVELISVSNIPVIPTVSSEFTLLTQKADAILDKINALPLDTLISDVQNVATTLQQAAESVESTSEDFDDLLADFDAEQINEQINTVLSDVTLLLKNYSEGGLSKAEIQQTMNALQETMRSIQPLLLQLNQAPNSLIFSDNRSTDIQPKAGTQNNE